MHIYVIMKYCVMQKPFVPEIPEEVFASLCTLMAASSTKNYYNIGITLKKQLAISLAVAMF